MKRKLFTGLLTALLVLAVSLTCALADIVLPDVPALDLEDMVDIAAIEAGVPQVTYRVENGELIAEGEIDCATLTIDGPDDIQMVELTYHAEDDTWRAPCESLNSENGSINLEFWRKEYRLCFSHRDMNDVTSFWAYTGADRNDIIFKNEFAIHVTHPQQKYSAQYDIHGNLTYYTYYDSNRDGYFNVHYDVAGNLKRFYVNIPADEYGYYSWAPDKGWSYNGLPCDPPAGYEHRKTAEDFKALMPPLVVADQPDQAQANLPDKPALKLSDMGIDLAAIEERVPQGTYRVENGELIVEGSDDIASVLLSIYREDEEESVELTYHRADDTWRAPCKSLKIKNGYAEIDLSNYYSNGVLSYSTYTVEGTETSFSWDYSINNRDIGISKRKDNSISVSYDTAKYTAHYNAAGELEKYEYYNKPSSKINYNEDIQVSISYDAEGNIVWFHIIIFKNGSGKSYRWTEDEGWMMFSTPCDPPAGYEHLKTAEDIKALMPPLVVMVP